MSLTKTDVFDLTKNLIETAIDEASFSKYQYKKYIFHIGNPKEAPFNFLYINIGFNQKIIWCNLKSVYNRHLVGKTIFCSDGVFNKISFVINSASPPPYYSSYIFSHNYESYKNTITRVINDYKLSGKKFFEFNPENQKIISKGLKFIDELSIPPKELARALHQEGQKGRFWGEINHPVYTELVTYLTPYWSALSFEHLPLLLRGNGQRRLYYFAFHLLYFYIKDHIKKTNPKIPYMAFQLKET